MSADHNSLRTELDRKFQSPIDVLIDPSLLVASRSLNRLSNSKVLASQTQATLGRTPTEPRLGNLFVPTTFHELISDKKQPAVQKTDVWDFYRGQAEPSIIEDIIEILNENEVDEFSEESASVELNWTNALDAPDQQEQLLLILKEELSFLQSGGIVLSRTSAAFETFRDAGVPSIDVGKAELLPQLRETLTDLGYRSPASVCGFGVSTAKSTVDALTGGVLTQNPELLLYRLGS